MITSNITIDEVMEVYKGPAVQLASLYFDDTTCTTLFFVYRTFLFVPIAVRTFHGDPSFKVVQTMRILWKVVTIFIRGCNLSFGKRDAKRKNSSAHDIRAVKFMC